MRNPIRLLSLVLVSILLFGTVALGYGFTQIGLHVGSIPLPLADILLGLSLIGIVLADFFRMRIGWLGILLLTVFGWASYRLLADYSEWGTLALRDYVHYVEMWSLIVGYWIAYLLGSKGFTRFWSWLFGITVLYGLFYPYREFLMAISPRFSLVKTAPLLGFLASASIAGALFFLLLNVRHPIRFALGSGCLGIMAYLQFRALYLALPLITILAFLFGTKESGKHLFGGILGSVAGGALLLALIVPVMPSGRVGSVDAAFIWNHLQTVFGMKGPESGSVEHRRLMIDETLSIIADTPGGWLLGVGLGPDLIGGVEPAGDPSIRKPHNDYLEVLGRLGLVGLVPWLAIWFLGLLSMLRSSRSAHVPPDIRILLTSLGCVLLAYMCIAATQPLLSYSYGAIPAYTLLGAGYYFSREFQYHEGH